MILVTQSILATLLASVLPLTAFAQETGADARQTRFLVRALTHDRNLELGSKKTLRVLVVHNAPDRAAAIVAALHGKKVEKLLLSAHAAEFEDIAGLVELLDRGGFGAVYVDTSALSALSSVLQATRSRKVPSVAEDPSMVERGVALGVHLVEGQPRIIVNLRAAKSEGSDFDANFLNVATVLR